MMNQNMAWDLTARRQFRRDFRFHRSICFLFRWNQFPVSGASVASLFSSILFWVCGSSPTSLMFLTEIDIDFYCPFQPVSCILDLLNFWHPNPRAQGLRREWSTPSSLGGHPLSAVSPGAFENLLETLPFPSLLRIPCNFISLMFCFISIVQLNLMWRRRFSHATMHFVFEY